MTTQQQTIPVDLRSENQQPAAERLAGSTDRDAQAPALADGESAPQAELGTSYLPNQTSARASERWQSIQSEFVDDPRKSVTEAHGLVGELMQRIVDEFTQERDELERQWSEGNSASTEDLRLCLQRYRAFFSRLLPSMHGAHTER